MNTYAVLQSRRTTSQSSPIPGTAQVSNSAGGHAWVADMWYLLDRFLIIGTEGGTYYTDERKLTRDACTNLSTCIATDGVRTVNRIVTISLAGRTLKQDALIFAHVLCAKTGNTATRQRANGTMSSVCRTGTMLFSWMACIREIGGIGPGTRRALCNWYLDKSLPSLTYQLCKYRQRGGWTHRDVLRLAHPKPADIDMGTLLKWVTGHGISDAAEETLPKRNKLLDGFITLQGCTTAIQAAELISSYGLVREMVQSAHLQSADVWSALLQNMPFTAMVRNLGKMSAVGLLAPLSDAESTVCQQLTDTDRIVGSRIHPIAVLNALRTYASGHGLKGKLTWPVCNRIVDALAMTFEKSFASVEPTGKRYYLALDVSSSMAWTNCAGAASLTPREASAAIAMITARQGDAYVMRAFSHSMVDLDIASSDSLRTAVDKVSRLPFGATDCALPMLDAIEHNLSVDCFIIYTDSETWIGDVHPCQALQRYRAHSGIAAKLVIVSMVGNAFTIADPSDAGMLDVVGFDSTCLRLINEFAKE